MKKFTFKATETLVKYVEIEAETKDEAFDMADELLESGEIDFEKNIHYYSEIELV